MFVKWDKRVLGMPVWIWSLEESCGTISRKTDCSIIRELGNSDLIRSYSFAELARSRVGHHPLAFELKHAPRPAPGPRPPAAVA